MRTEEADGTITITCAQEGSDQSIVVRSDDEARDQDWIEDRAGRWYSPSAMSYGFICPSCEYWTHEDDGNWVEDEEEYWCEACTSDRCGWCDRCEHWYHHENTCEVVIEGRTYNETWCESCIDDNQEVYWDDNDEVYRYDENRGRIQYDLNSQMPRGLEPGSPEWQIAKAKMQIAEQTNLWVYDSRFANYHNSDHGKFKGLFYREENEHPYLYYGVELEVQFVRDGGGDERNRIAKEFIEMTNGLFVAESDSSIGYGIEFISRPLSYKKWTSKEVTGLLEKGFKYLKDQGAIAEQPESCGMHIHMSRKFFERNTEKNTIEIRKDMDWIVQYFQSQIEAIGGRKFTHYCEPKKDYIVSRIREIRDHCSDTSAIGFGTDTFDFVAVLKKGGDIANGSMYHHAAITQRNDTFEVRAFKSTIKLNEFLANIQLCRNLAHAARNLKIDDMTFEQLISTKESPELDQRVYELERRGKIDTKRICKNEMEVTL